MVTKAEALRRKRANRPQPKTGAGPAEPRIVKPPEPKPSARDGWLWLIEKTRVTTSQRRAGDYYRRLYRDPGMAPPIGSCLEMAEGGGGSTGGGLPARMASEVDARTELILIQNEVLSCHADMIDLLDAVCGRGVTLRERAHGNDRETLRLEAVLKVALDLVSWYRETDRRAA